jgi:Tol biopolymer transport system component
VEDGKAKKMKMTTDSVLANSVYPSWHPSLPLVAFSSNQTGQVFHLTDRSKIEVIDYASDLVLYDVEQATITNILRTKEYLETFPHWSPDGKRLFFSSAYTTRLAQLPDSVRSDSVIQMIDSLHYDVYSIQFDPTTRKFSDMRLEVMCSERNRSAAVPRVSPDGNYLLFTEGRRGQFHIWHPEADLYVKNLVTDSIRCLTNASGIGPDSYHTWSSNGRWIVVASRRDDGSYSRVYISYFDTNGNDHKAFVLPQLDPEHNFCRMKSYNVPELTRNAVRSTPEQLREVIYDGASMQQVTYKDR